MTTKLAFVPAFVVTLPTLNVGTVIRVAVPVAVPNNPFTTDEIVKVKFLPLPDIFVAIAGKVTLVAPAAKVAVPVDVV